MKQKNPPISEILDAVLDGTATDAQRRQIAQVLDQEQSIGEIVEQMRVHSLLQWQCGALNQPSNENETPRIKLHGSLTGWVPTTSSKFWRWAAAIAFIVCGAAGLYKATHRENSLAVAEIVDESRVVWSEENPAVTDGKQIVPGKLKMLSGELTLRFRSGATVSATGTVSMRIASDMLVYLDRGQATAHVPQWAKGFTIKTSSAEVIDLGTKFGVMAHEGGTTDVVVFEGEVDLKPIPLSSVGLRRLVQGEGARVGNSGEIDRIVEISRSSEGTSWSSDAPTGGNSVFKSVQDNIHLDDSAKYYAIVPQGFTDDALAYGDRPHEWNGLTVEGLPKFLQDADYIRTFNTTRYMTDMRIAVEMAKAADVYILFDSRIPPPRWLIDEFEDTDVEIGLDEGPWNPGDALHVVGVGGGHSLDTVFAVWRRRCQAGETLELGPLSKRLKSLPPCAMYGIAAQPLD